MNKVKITIDNKNFLVNPNKTIIQACLSNDVNIEIPRFCFHEKLSIAGNCRMCLVEVKNSIKPVASCAMQISENMVIYTNTSVVKKAREGVLEFLLANHPLDCPICDQGGECDLQDQSLIFGGDKGRFHEYKRSVEDKDCGPFIKTIMTRCIHCTRCVRFLNEVAGNNILGMVGRGSKSEIGTYLPKIIDSELSGNIIDLCPVGALTSKPYAFTSRSWELSSEETVDILDSFCSDIRVDLRGTEVMRILPRLNEAINEYWISDITRFSYDGLKAQRLDFPYIKNNNKFLTNTWENLFIKLQQHLFINKYVLKRNLKFNSYSNSLVDSETQIFLKDLLNYSGSFHYVNNIFYKNFNNINFDFRNSYLLPFSKDFLKEKNLIFLIGLNLRLESPLYNLRVRRIFLKKKIKIINISPYYNLTYYCNYIGLGFFEFLKFMEGNHFLSNLSSLYNSNSPSIIFGSYFYKRSDFYNISRALMFFNNFYFDNNIVFGFLQNNLSNITSGEINLLPCSNSLSSYSLSKNLENKKLSNNLSCNYNFFLGFDYLNLDNNNFNFNFLISSYRKNLSDKYDFMLPSKNFLEKDSSYLNLEGQHRLVYQILPTLNQKNNLESEALEELKILTIFLSIYKAIFFFKYIYYSINYYLNNYIFVLFKKFINLFFNFDISYKGNLLSPLYILLLINFKKKKPMDNLKFKWKFFNYISFFFLFTFLYKGALNMKYNFYSFFLYNNNFFFKSSILLGNLKGGKYNTILNNNNNLKNSIKQRLKFASPLFVFDSNKVAFSSSFINFFFSKFFLIFFYNNCAFNFFINNYYKNNSISLHSKNINKANLKFKSILSLYNL